MSELTISSNHQPLEPPVAPRSAEALDALDDAPEVPAAPVHDYGSTTEVPAGYVSDAELLAWLQAKSSGQYGELDQLMDASNARSKLIKDLSDLKESLSNPAKDPAQALAELQAIQTAYAGTEHAEAIVRISVKLPNDIQGADPRGIACVALAASTTGKAAGHLKALLSTSNELTARWEAAAAMAPELPR